MVIYDIQTDPGPSLLEWIRQQPNLVSVNYDGMAKIICEFNHDAAQENQFRTEIASRMFQVDTGGGVVRNIFSELEEIQTDQYFYGTELAVTKTNIGTAYVNVYNDYGGRPFGIDTTGFTQMAIHVLWNRVATDAGVQTIRIVDNANVNNVVAESSALPNGAVLSQFNNVAIPAGFRNFIGMWRIQAKSTVATDDPVFNGIRIYLRR